MHGAAPPRQGWGGLGRRHRLFADTACELDGRAGVGDAEASAGQDLFVGSRVQVREALGELDFLSIDGLYWAMGVGPNRTCVSGRTVSSILPIL